MVCDKQLSAPPKCLLVNRASCSFTQIFVFVLACGLQYSDGLYVNSGPLLAKQMSLGPLGTFYQNSLLGGGGGGGGSSGGGFMDNQWVN